MSSLHLPIIVGHDESERVIIVHLLDNEEHEYEENRVVITPSCNSNKPLFRIAKNAKLICDDGTTVNIKHSFTNDLKDNEARLAVYEEPKDTDTKVQKIVKLDEQLLSVTNVGKKFIVADPFRIIGNNNKQNDNDDCYTEVNCIESDAFVVGAKICVYPAGTCISVVKVSSKKTTEFKFKIDENVSLKNTYYEYKVRTAIFDGVHVFNALVKTGGQEKTYKGEIHIVRADTTKVVRINADLGSDATQINYYLQKNAVGIQGINIVERLRDEYASVRDYGNLSQPANGKPLYMQQDVDNQEFYKTGNITFKKGGDITKPISDSDTFINYLNVSAAGKNESGNSGKITNTWGKESNFNKKLINIKMLYSHLDIAAVKNPVADIDFITETGKPAKRVTDKVNLLQVLRSIYKQLIILSTKGNIEENCKLVSVLLLVPNIYVQQNIDSLLYELNQLNKNDDGIKYDFRIISESDSAFVGIKEVEKEGGTQSILSSLIEDVETPKQKDYFLIIDAGKGTTDYSIIQYNPTLDSSASNKIISLRRGGIVGAGGAIDYVFARVFARQVFNNFKTDSTSIDMEEFVSRFMNMIQKLAPSDQDTMMQYVELLKKTYNTKPGKLAQVCTCFSGGSAKNIIGNLIQDDINDEKYNNIVVDDDAWKEVASWIWNKNSYEEYETVDINEIDWVCNAIAGTIVDNMIFVNKKDSINKSIDYVIFTGRSFLFKPLKEAFLKKIESYRGVYKENFDYYELKKVSIWVSEKMGSKDNEKKDWKNLKDANLDGFDMKSVSVRFSEHDLGVNCNSDLCCMEGIQLDNGETFDKTRFWNGFKVAKKEKQYYYIGFKDTSFVPNGMTQGLMRTVRQNPIRTKLVHMTLFPVSYVPVIFD